MKTTQLRTRILLTLQSALLGMVTKNMRAVLVSWNETDITIRVIFDGAPSVDDNELASEIETEVISHIPELTVRCVAESDGQALQIQLNPGEVFVFQRATRM